MRAAVPCASLLVIVGCSTASTSPSPPPSSSSSGDPIPNIDAGTSTPDATAPPKHAEALAIGACAARAPSVERSSLGIVALVDHLNRLPRPLDLPCFIASLPRPLGIVATTSRASAQPAASAKSPRIFLFLPKLIVSVVPEGDASPYAELGEWATTTRTIKAEIAFPLPGGSLAKDEPFLRVEQATTKTTTCGVCHRDEAAHESIAHAYVSAAFRPVAAPVTYAELEAEHQACAKASDVAARCALFHAIFDFGSTVEGAFAREVDTF